MASTLIYLVIHCTHTPLGRNVTPEQIRRWHTAPKPAGRGWSRVGYSDMIMLNGTLVNLRKFDQDDIVQSDERTWGAYGINSMSRHIVYVGGTDRLFNPMDTLTADQSKSLEVYVKYMTLRHPNIKVCGHNQHSSKACPSFDVPSWCERIGLDEKNIYRG